jgi:hypothetical protein
MRARLVFNGICGVDFMKVHACSDKVFEQSFMAVRTSQTFGRELSGSNWFKMRHMRATYAQSSADSSAQLTLGICNIRRLEYTTLRGVGTCTHR